MLESKRAFVKGQAMRRWIFAILSTLVFSTSAMAEDSLIQLESHFNVEETAARMEQVLQDKGITVFARVNHSDAAHGVGMELRDTVLLMFGNPKIGSRLMQCQQSVAIDLPLKVLIWKDAHEKVWVSYNAFSYLQHRHQIEGCDATLSKMQKGLDTIVKLSVN